MHTLHGAAVAGRVVQGAPVVIDGADRLGGRGYGGRCVARPTLGGGTIVVETALPCVGRGGLVTEHLVLECLGGAALLDFDIDLHRRGEARAAVLVHLEAQRTAVAVRLDIMVIIVVGLCAIGHIAGRERHGRFRARVGGKAEEGLVILCAGIDICIPPCGTFLGSRFIMTRHTE